MGGGGWQVKGLARSLYWWGVLLYEISGKTEDLSQRLKQLDNTSMPLPFECIHTIEVNNSSKVDHLLHDAFADLRTR